MHLSPPASLDRNLLCSDMDNTPDPSAPEAQPALRALETQIALLTELTSTVQELRRATVFLQPSAIPAGISAGGGVLPIYHTPPISQGFEQLKALSEKVQSEAVQDALKVAREHTAKEPPGLSLGDKRKKSRR